MKHSKNRDDEYETKEDWTTGHTLGVVGGVILVLLLIYGGLKVTVCNKKGATYSNSMPGFCYYLP